MSAAETLTGYGMRLIGSVRIADGRFTITITDPETAKKECCIYAFVVGNKIVRVGSSKAKLYTRLNAWQRDVSRAWNGEASPTGAKEAAGWKAELESHGDGAIYARPGWLVETPVGLVCTYMSEENVLIGRHRPIFNNSMHR